MLVVLVLVLAVGGLRRTLFMSQPTRTLGVKHSTASRQEFLEFAGNNSTAEGPLSVGKMPRPVADISRKRISSHHHATM